MPQILEPIWQMKAPQIVLQGAFLVSETPPIEKVRGGTGNCRGLLAECLGKSYH